MEKIEVGDTVRVNGYGRVIAVVVGIKEGGCPYLVEFPKRSKYGSHNGGGFRLIAGEFPTSGKCRWFNAEELTLVRKAAPHD